MNRLSNRRVLSMACLMLAPLVPAWAQQTYQSPPADLVKILEAPANPITSISPNRQWVLVTVSDPRTVTISDMADSAYYLAGSKIRANPDYRIENIGVRSGTVSSVEGKIERTLQVPAGGRIGSTAWSSGGESNKRMYRNGSWFSDAVSVRVTRRDRYSPDSRFDNLGFRVVAVAHS